MYLKRLSLLGFKTFANRTEFEFQPGVSAIIGPNGSGKSNIADAIRWVLGEQSYATLRAKRTDDVIFAGGTATEDKRGRAPLQMAEVCLTIDNTDRKLPLDFSEVMITRRAYRSGENEYYINRSRVRLKDIRELAVYMGEAYAVVGQGLVDAALSLRPEERRGLFEDAADITHYQDRRNETERRLEKTEQNTIRVGDIVGELEPRLQGLEKSSQQAHEYARTNAELLLLLERWYGHRWSIATEELRVATTAEEIALAALEKTREEQDNAGKSLSELRTAQAIARRELGDFHKQSSSLHEESEQKQRLIAVNQERLNALSEQRESLAREIAPLKSEISLEEEAAANNKGELKKIEEEIISLQATLQEMDRESNQEEQSARKNEKELEKNRQEEHQAQKVQTSATQRLLQLAERKKELQNNLDKQEKTDKAHLEIVDNLKETLQLTRTKLEKVEKETQNLETEIERIRGEMGVSQDRQRTLETEAVKGRQEVSRLQTRQDLLRKLQDNHSGYFNGVKVVLDAASKSLQGIIGPVATLLQTPAELETAIETALGGHLQDIVVEHWSDAEAAIALLKKSAAGRATFLPLDTITAAPVNRPPRGDGVIGIANELVEFEKRYSTVFQQLLGRTLIVEDLTSARQAVSRPGNGGWTIVTRAGEIVRPGGSVTGGALGKENAGGGMLSRERELRELPGEQKLAKSKLEEIERKINVEGKTQQEKLAEIKRWEENQGQLRQAHRRSTEEVTSAQRNLDRAQQEMEWQERQSEQFRSELANLLTAEIQAGETLAKAEILLRTAKDAVKEAERKVEKGQKELKAQRERSATIRTNLAVARQRRQAQQEANTRQQRSLETLLAQQKSREEQLASLVRQRDDIDHRLKTARGELNQVATEISALAAIIAPIEERLTAAEIEQVLLEKESAEQSHLLRELEGSYSRATVKTHRLLEAEESLRQRIEEELSLRAEVVFEEAKRAEEPDALYARTESLRLRLRRLGPVNPQAIKEYEETRDRYNFLKHEYDDLQIASATLRKLIGELDLAMQQRFHETFDTIAIEFKRYFTRLFGGGTAKLALTKPEDMAATGIEIIAQPPGKRAQNLALLSGGERAMTAVALLFALLKVHPTPFCFLDEVDAALDEAAVGRFRNTLAELTGQTQFCLITHNRGTIEVAQTIYGISMDRQSVSRVVSLRLGGRQNKAQEEQLETLVGD